MPVLTSDELGACYSTLFFEKLLKGEVVKGALVLFGKRVQMHLLFFHLVPIAGQKFHL